jgi:hypothetical protein
MKYSLIEGKRRQKVFKNQGTEWAKRGVVLVSPIATHLD